MPEPKKKNIITVIVPAEMVMTEREKLEAHLTHIQNIVTHIKKKHMKTKKCDKCGLEGDDFHTVEEDGSKEYCTSCFDKWSEEK